MPERCFIWSCQSSGKLPNIYYFRFGSRKELWLEALGIPDKDISSRNLLCSKHFDASDVVFPDSEHGRVRLKPKAVPKHFIIKRKSTDILSSEPPKKKVARKHHDMLEQEQPSTSMNKQPSNDYEAEVVHIPKHMKEQLSSSTDSAGLKHTPKRNRRLIKKIHTYRCVHFLMIT
ncbi:unnamed protein product [Phaedon cochleariae]|uniref:THAP-type domain-containing protein n=1 Tax=Phaedon cochleariae TaxID=80249 RepID=A0A9N9X077_PHACE|nr:unnamed protein product [Phaedon cochleariae]